MNATENKSAGPYRRGKSGHIRPGERVVWVGDDDLLPVGSSVKARAVTRQRVAIDPIEGSDAHRRDDLDWRLRGSEIVSCEEAALRGIEPWVSSLPPSMGGTYEPDPNAPHTPTPNILGGGLGRVRRLTLELSGEEIARHLADTIRDHFQDEDVHMSDAERDQLAQHLISYGVSWVMGLKGLS